MANDTARILPHIFLDHHGQELSYTSPKRGGGKQNELPARDHAKHGAKIGENLSSAIQQLDQMRQDNPDGFGDDAKAYTLQFLAHADHPGVAGSLQDRRGKKITELLSVKEFTGPQLMGHLATVRMPEGNVASFRKKIDAYTRGDRTKHGNIRHERKLGAIISLTPVMSAVALLTGSQDATPEPDQPAWFELWLLLGCRPVIERAAKALDFTVDGRTLTFAEREVVLVQASMDQLDSVVQRTNCIAEIRQATEAQHPHVDLSVTDQSDWCADLLTRVTGPSADDPAVCVLGPVDIHPLAVVGVEFGG